MERPKYGFAGWPAEKRRAFLREIALAHPMRGFALMPKDRRVEVARRGGQNAHQPGRGGHEWTAEEAQSAGQRGGLASGRTRRARAAAINDAITLLLAEAKAAKAASPLTLVQAALRLVRRLEAAGIILSLDQAGRRLRRRDGERLLLRESGEK